MKWRQCEALTRINDTMFAGWDPTVPSSWVQHKTPSRPSGDGAPPGFYAGLTPVWDRGMNGGGFGEGFL